jgi:hypothetical protein
MGDDGKRVGGVIKAHCMFFIDRIGVKTRVIAAELERVFIFLTPMFFYI